MNVELLLKQARILIVDDQFPNVKLLEKLLRSSGYTNVTSTTDPQEGVRLYGEQGFDLVLLDIRMPVMDGFEVMARLAEIEKEGYIPVLVLTAQTDRETRVRALEGGARDFLTKPFDRLEVLSRIRNLLEVRLLHREVRDHNLQLEEKVRKRTEALYQARLDLIRRLGRASEYRDNETGLHIIRMSKCTEVIARNAGWNKADSELILNASAMHDVGKLGIPDRVLLKPGKLTAEEWEVMQSHTSIGAALLAGSEDRLMETARQIAMSHHERWDGSGYPLGLAGEQIPPEARIASVSDVFDALLSERPYKKPWTLEEAVAEIRAQAGRQFDPDFIASFDKSLPEMLEIQKEFADPG
ncbi:MAG: response regulator [Magnetococcales bacterium]|nr:response regulator [Magnetococcales bacterium]